MIAAWGVHGAYQDRMDHVRSLLKEAGVTIYAIASSKDGIPRHPLYLKGDAERAEYTYGEQDE